ncbi:hypothetical protein R1sor_016346 [Riccia sorocarpa]|uniref:Uncharacterized protein n=1 Tax=Riccia sorocarpa TaxID=122646 RepID=A0ABD3HHI0_9MARC
MWEERRDKFRQTDKSPASNVLPDARSSKSSEVAKGSAQPANNINSIGAPEKSGGSSLSVKDNLDKAENPDPMEPADPNAGFILVSGRRGKGGNTGSVGRSPRTKSSNSFDALADLEVEVPAASKETEDKGSPADSNQVKDPGSSSQIMVVNSSLLAPKAIAPIIENPGRDIRSPSSPPPETLLSLSENTLDKLPEHLPDQANALAVIPIGYLGPWDELTDEEMPEFQTRGVKGCPEEDIRHTPDRGNDSKRRKKITNPRSEAGTVLSNRDYGTHEYYVEDRRKMFKSVM